jgi:hypothetical protein
VRMRSPHVCASLRWEPEPFSINNVAYVLRNRDSPCDLQAVIVPSEEKILAEIKLLLSAVAGNFIWKANAQTSPTFSAFLPCLNFSDLEARQHHKEWSCEVSPSCIAVEVCSMKQVPGGIQRVPIEGRPGIRALLYDSTSCRFDRNSVGSKHHMAIGLAERTDDCALLVRRRDRSRPRGRLRELDAFRGQQAPRSTPSSVMRSRCRAAA